MTNVLYVHGLGGSSASSTCAALRAILPECKVLADDFDLFDVRGTLGKIARLVEEKEIGVLAGSSLGAFYVLASRAPRRLAINPCMRPSAEIPRLAPKIPASAVEEFSKIEPTLSGDGATAFGVFGSADALFSFRGLFAERFPAPPGRTNVAVVEGGRHKLTREELSAPVRLAFELLLA